MKKQKSEPCSADAILARRLSHSSLAGFFPPLRVGVRTGVRTHSSSCSPDPRSKKKRSCLRPRGERGAARRVVPISGCCWLLARAQSQSLGLSAPQKKQRHCAAQTIRPSLGPPVSGSHPYEMSAGTSSGPVARLFVLFLTCFTTLNGQRITTIQLDGVQYFVSRMNPYSPELNYFLAYQYCRSLGLQLASFETREKADSITQYLSNAGYNKYDFWTSGNKLGTDMYLWMSTGLPFNATFNYMKKSVNSAEEESVDIPSGSTSPQRTARESDSGASSGCVTLKAPSFEWDTDDCMTIKDFICEQTRCYYYNYGSIPVSSAQGRPSTSTTTTTTTTEKPSPSNSINNNNNNGITLDNNAQMYELVSKLSSRWSSSSQLHKELAKDTFVHPSEIDQSTNGPYDSVHSSGGSNVELLQQDDPNSHHGGETDYSTFEPETVTIYERSFVRPLI